MSTAIRESAECVPSEGVSFRESARTFRRLFETMAEQPPLSVSIGVADYPEGGQTIEELLRTADRELYEMKSGVGGGSPVGRAW